MRPSSLRRRFWARDSHSERIGDAIIAARCRAAIKSEVHYARLEPREWISEAELAAVRACWYTALSRSNIHEERGISLASTTHGYRCRIRAGKRVEHNNASSRTSATHPRRRVARGAPEQSRSEMESGNGNYPLGNHPLTLCRGNDAEALHTRVKYSVANRHRLPCRCVLAKEMPRPRRAAGTRNPPRLLPAVIKRNGIYRGINGEGGEESGMKGANRTPAETPAGREKVNFHPAPSLRPTLLRRALSSYLSVSFRGFCRLVSMRDARWEITRFNSAASRENNYSRCFLLPIIRLFFSRRRRTHPFDFDCEAPVRLSFVISRSPERGSTLPDWKWSMPKKKEKKERETECTSVAIGRA